LRAVRAEQIRSRLSGVSASTTLGMVLVFGAVLRALEPAELSAVFSLVRLALHGLVCFALGTMIAWVSAGRALAELASLAQRGEAERRRSGVEGDATGAARHMLHAASVCFEEISAESPDPSDFAELLASLR